ncbi:hypothetical protein AXF42_Ash000542 [Apostasia shenzhenica]|uniref:Uncharacterized protein n=1 Tax=Apostasia shenzhenica TaxID=1088818 RepID=A0A2I0AGN6_9ASPA|nr:hypothetical protein AXF42_Ash000542 [Apostasia shenzhenica]
MGDLYGLVSLDLEDFLPYIHIHAPLVGMDVPLLNDLVDIIDLRELLTDSLCNSLFQVDFRSSTVKT